jgi:hypothetical protein
MLHFSVKRGIIMSSLTCDLNSVSSSTDKTNLLGSIPSRLHSPAPRVHKSPRVSDSSVGGSTSLSLKPAPRNSLELISIVTGDRDVSTSGVHSWNVSPDTSSSTLLRHHLMTRSQSPFKSPYIGREFLKKKIPKKKITWTEMVKSNKSGL